MNHNRYVAKIIAFYLSIITPTILAQIPTVPSIQDEIFSFPANGQIPKIGLTFVHGVVS